MGLSYRHTKQEKESDDGLRIRFFPLSYQKIAFDHIIGYEFRTCDPVRGYGGWGIRYERGVKLFNENGGRGVYLELSNGRHLLLGSLRPEALARTIGMHVRH